MHERVAEIRFHSEGAEARDAACAAALDRARAAGCNAALVRDAGARSAVLTFSAACGKRGLAAWVTVAPDADGRPCYSAHAVPLLATWLVDGEDALDPRRPPRPLRLRPVDRTEGLVDAWCEEVGAIAVAGVAGVICQDADRLPPAFWRTLLARSPKVQWLAWTPGLAPSSIRALIDSGFDGVCSSLAWWDGSSGWLIDERQRQRGAMQLVFPLDPFAIDEGGRSAAAKAEEARRFRSRLWMGAVVGDALLLPATSWDLDAMHAIREVNRWWSGEDDRSDGFRATDVVRMFSGPDAPVTVIARANAPDLRAADRVAVALVGRESAGGAPIDAGMNGTVSASLVRSALSGFGDFRSVGASDAAASPIALDPCAALHLAPGEVRVFEGRRRAALSLPPARGVAGRAAARVAKAVIDAAIEAPRIAIENITPSVDEGRFPVKRIAGEAVRVEADLLIDGHEKLAAALRYRAIGERDWREVRMEPVGNDRYAASFPLLRVGRHEFTVEAWRDGFATFRDELDKKSAAGLDVSLEIAEGRLLVADAIGRAKTARRGDVAGRLNALLHGLDAATATADVASRDATRMAAQVAALLASQTRTDMQAADARDFATRTQAAFAVDAERSGASFASWYELFPRSQGNRPGAPLRHGTFDDVIDRLPAIRAMGFDVLYFTPIHPIGNSNRKGRNNSLAARDGDPGSPYAIGSERGGHDALHPELGSFEDFERLRLAALEHGLELALDFAIQCSPDHPWLQSHPEWFAWRPDGSLRHAENPPKKYEDIVNVDFYARIGHGVEGGEAQAALWSALRDVILHWVERGVRIFRVDNPHTKPLPFWEWMIGDIRARYPDVIFLSEAFTRPKLMYRLAKLGFSQSYTYFTWRHGKEEFIDYLTELTAAPPDGSKRAAPRDFFRPHFFVNTPDINPVFLQRSGRAGFLIRAALASTLSGLWGIYSGFELCEATPVPGKEEYHDSEKYEIRAWDWERPGNIIAEISTLNRIRHQNPALHTHLNIRFHQVFDPNILYFVKATEDRSNIVLIAINLDPYGVHEADFEVPLWEWGLPDDATVDVTDLLTDRRVRWQGKIQRVRLDPMLSPYAIWRIAP